MRSKTIRLFVFCYILLIPLISFALDDNKYHGGSYDGHGIATSASDQSLGLFLTEKYHGGSYDGYGIGTSASDQSLGLFLTDKYHGGSYDGYGNGTSAPDIAFVHVLLATRVLLEGPYDTEIDQMTTLLNSEGNIPLTAPYSHDNREVSGIPSNISDWVLVQLRSLASGPAIVSKSVFLHKNGSVVADDGITGQIILNAVDDGDYFIVITHRNHLPVMSAGTHPLSGGSSALYDFTTGSGKFYGTSGAKELEPGVWGMWSGDINQDGEVTTEDYTTWYNSARAGDSGYQTTDINLDGEVTTSDYTIWYNNARAGASSTVP